MRVRGLLATTGLVASALLLPSAMAEEAVDEACQLVTDATNDTEFQGQGETEGVLVQRDIDITSADVSTTEDHLFAVIRVQDLGARPPTTYAQGQTVYRIEFGAGKRRFYVQVPTGWATLSQSRYYWPYGSTAGRVGGRPYHAWSQLDYFNSEITLDAPLHVFGTSALQPGTTITDYAVTAVRTYTDNGQIAPGVSSRVSVSDAASSKALYSAAAPSCITPAPSEEEPVVEPDPAPSPTAEPEPAPSPTAEPEPAPSPTAEPEPAPSPTAEPEPAPSEAPSESPAS